MAPDEEIRNLATFYLTYGRQLWPELAERGVLPEPQADVVNGMVDDFRQRHKTGQIDSISLQSLLWIGELSALYPRFSDDNSQPKSIVDQARQALDRAKAEKLFVPWLLTFSDYSRSATQGFRQGFSNLLKAIRQHSDVISAVLIDEFMRASRNDAEWWRLASLCKRQNVRLLGASDGFHLDDDDWDTKVGFYNLITKMETKYKRQRVRRGMRGSAGENRPLGKLPLGFTRRPVLDGNGNAVLKPSGKPQTERCIDPETAEHTKEMFRLFVVEKWTAYKIMLKFNREKVDGWNGWRERTIKMLLVNPAFIGLFIWNRTRNEYNWDTNQWEKLRNPWQEWEWFYDPKLALIPKNWHVYARNKIDKDRTTRTGGRNGKADKCPVTLFSETLECSYCEKEIKLIRSADKYKQMACLNGINQAHDCVLTTSKSTRIIEECLLGFISEAIFTEENLVGLVERANAHLAEEAMRPSVDVRPLRAEARKLDTKIKRLFERIENCDNEALCGEYDRRIAEHAKELNQCRGSIQAAEKRNRKPPPPLNLERVETYLSDLRGVLSQEIPAAAEAIRTLTGTIRIRQEEQPGDKKGTRWIATLSPDLLGLLSTVAKERDYPDSVTLEFLRCANWIKRAAVDVPLEDVPEYEELAPKMLAMKKLGVSVNDIGAAFGKTWQVAKAIIGFAETGERPYRNQPKKHPRRSDRASNVNETAVPRYIQHAPEVARMRDDENMPFTAIARRLHICEQTVRRAYDHVHRDDVRKAVGNGEKPSRGRYSHLGEKKYRQIRKLLAKGVPVTEIAKKVGCGTSTVYRERRRVDSASAGRNGEGA